jgi:hypothetical protein
MLNFGLLIPNFMALVVACPLGFGERGKKKNPRISRQTEHAVAHHQLKIWGKAKALERTAHQ